jgi:hypothetical protein
VEDGCLVMHFGQWIGGRDVNRLGLESTACYYIIGIESRTEMSHVGGRD